MEQIVKLHNKRDANIYITYVAKLLDYTFSNTQLPVIDKAIKLDNMFSFINVEKSIRDNCIASYNLFRIPTLCCNDNRRW